MTVKVSAKLTRAEQEQNGLDDLRRELIEQPRGRRYAVVAFEVLRVQKEIADGEEIPTVRLVHIEPLTGADADTVQKLLEGAYEERTGKAPQLPLDFGVEGPDGSEGDGERQVPEAGAEELLAEAAERRAAGLPAFSGGDDAA